jgi:cyclase
VGNQSIVVVLDVKQTGLINQRYQLFTHNGQRDTKIHPVEFARQVQALGAGEILVNSIDRDGTLKGYDTVLIDQLRQVVTIPMTVLGGAGSYADISTLIERYGIIGAAAGSLFVFKGKYRAVLIQYPKRDEKDAIVSALAS